MTLFLALLTAFLFAWLIKIFVAPAHLADWVRNRFVPVEYGLAPREQLDAHRAGPPLPVYRRKEMQALADAAWEGDWRPAAAYVEAAGQNWDERWSRLALLREIAEGSDAWLDEWCEAQPKNCAAATLHAEMLLHRAWQIRGGAYADKVPAEKMARFHELLPASMTAAREAALLAPEDPGPWVVMITAARGVQYTPEQFRPLWDGLVARAP
ncbi:hypothetical protein ACIHCQ_38240 [Streptomyces sp. NPDC052236]|uniref:hypothetical protein n=1 Tax=Streptomyces sp. NPDC052236 TaxID=3365686 RepID=UPI0037D27A32